MKLNLPILPPQVKGVLIAIGLTIAVALASVGVANFLARWNDGPAQRSAQAKVDERVQNAAVASQDAAVEKFADHVRERETIKEKETHYVETIHAAPGANDPMPAAVHDAGIAAIVGLRDASADGNSAAAPVSR
jgi:hypothetical protein